MNESTGKRLRGAIETQELCCGQTLTVQKMDDVRVGRVGTEPLRCVAFLEHFYGTCLWAGARPVLSDRWDSLPNVQWDTGWQLCLSHLARRTFHCKASLSHEEGRWVMS